jgi:hypothetical protein
MQEQVGLQPTGSSRLGRGFYRLTASSITPVMIEKEIDVKRP